MFLADLEPALQVGGAALGLSAFVLTLVKTLTQDKVWRSLIAEVRVELTDCREERAKERAESRAERAERDTKIQTLTGEVIALRRFVHEDEWLGSDPRRRPGDPTGAS